MQIQLRCRELGLFVENPRLKIAVIFNNYTIAREKFRQAVGELQNHEEFLANRYGQTPFEWQLMDLTIAVKGTNGFLRFVALQNRWDTHPLVGCEFHQILYDESAHIEPRIREILATRVRSK
jgi:hypothetical protein